MGQPSEFDVRTVATLTGATLGTQCMSRGLAAGPATVRPSTLGRDVFVRLLVLGAIVTTIACNSASSTSPSSPESPQPQVQTLFEMSGRVLLRFDPTTPIPNATVTVLEGRNAGKRAVTDSLGRYRIGDLLWEGFSATVSAPGYISEQKGVDLDVSNSFDMLPVEVFSRTGIGAATILVPSHVPLLHLQFRLISGSCQRVQVITIQSDGAREATQTWVIGPIDYRQRCDEASWWGRPLEFDVQARGGAVQVVDAAGIEWTMTEKRQTGGGN